MSEPALGYRKADEDLSALEATQKPMAAMDFEPPEQVDHSGWLKVEHQGPLSSCVGNAESSVFEVCNYIKTAGGIVHVSRWFAYIQAQKASGFFGADQGASIDGARRAAENIGNCLETTLPYPNPARYVTTIPQAAIAEAGDHQLLSHLVHRSYADNFRFIASGQGGIIIGVDWTTGMRACTGVMELSTLKGGMLGGHAMAIVGYTKRKAADGRNYLHLVNSHGTTWGNKGWAEVAPAVIDLWHQRREVMIGFSDLESWGPRNIPSFVGMTG